MSELLADYGLEECLEDALDVAAQELHITSTTQHPLSYDDQSDHVQVQQQHNHPQNTMPAAADYYGTLHPAATNLSQEFQHAVNMPFITTSAPMMAPFPPNHAAEYSQQTSAGRHGEVAFAFQPTNPAYSGGRPVASALTMINFQQSSSTAAGGMLTNYQYAPAEKQSAGNKPARLLKRMHEGPQSAERQQPQGAQPIKTKASKVCTICQRPNATQIYARAIFRKKDACGSCAIDPSRALKELMEKSLSVKCNGNGKCGDIEKVRELLQKAEDKGKISPCRRYHFYLHMDLDEKLLSKVASLWIMVVGFTDKTKTLKYFEQYGTITQRKQHKLAKNCLYLCFSSISEKRKAFASNKTILGQQMIMVQHCDEPTMDIVMDIEDGKVVEEQQEKEREEERENTSAGQQQSSSRTSEKEDFVSGRQSLSHTAEMDTAEIEANLEKSADKADVDELANIMEKLIVDEKLKRIELLLPNKCMELYIPADKSPQENIFIKTIYDGKKSVELLRVIIGHSISERKLSWFIQLIIGTSIASMKYDPVSRLRFYAMAEPIFSTKEYLQQILKEIPKYDIRPKDICDGDFATVTAIRWSFIRVYHSNGQLSIKREICSPAILPLMDNLFQLSNIIKGGRHFTDEGETLNFTLFTEDIVDKIVLGEDVSLAANVSADSIIEFVTQFGSFGCQTLELTKRHCTTLDPEGWLPGRVCDMLRNTPLPEECVGNLVLQYSPQTSFKWPFTTMKLIGNTASHNEEEYEVVYELVNLETKNVFEISIVCLAPLKDHYNKNGIRFSSKRINN